MPKVALELINLDRNQHKFFMLPTDIDYNILTKLLDFPTLEWDTADIRIKEILKGVRVDPCDIAEGTLTHWYELGD